MSAATFLPLDPDRLFGVENLPYGVFSTQDGDRRVGVRIGDHVLDVAAVLDAGAPAGADRLAAPTLNAFMAAGRPIWTETRRWLQGLLSGEARRPAVEAQLVPLEQAQLHLPFEVADYVDFYSSEHHAANVGRMFRPGTDPLPPSWRHLPIGYHGRSATVVTSGTPIIRPSGQRMPPEADQPSFGPSGRLDMEAEVGFVVGAGSPHGEPIPIDRVGEHLFGVCLVNDWSARDLQAWEYVPLGPFLGKSFATSISPWIVPLDALTSARVRPPTQDPEPLPYLRATEPWGLDLALEVEWSGTVVSRPPFASMYWTPAQQLAHLTSNGAAVRTGDLYASGTVSGPEPGQRGCCLELSWNGTEPVELADGSTRTFLEDGDTVTIRASAPGPDGTRIGFGEVTGTVTPARPAAPGSTRGS